MASTTIPTCPPPDRPAAADAADAAAAAAGGDEREPLPEAPGEREVLVVGVAGRRWAVRLEAARQVIRARSVTRVPGAPAWVMGVLNVRGAVVPVGDLRALDGRSHAAAREGLVLLVEEGGRVAGLRVAEVVGVRAAAVALSPGSAEPPAATRGARVGLPSAGVARLTPDGATGADDTPGAEVPLLDVRAVLDELLDGDAHS